MKECSPRKVGVRADTPETKSARAKQFGCGVESALEGRSQSAPEDEGILDGFTVILRAPAGHLEASRRVQRTGGGVGFPHLEKHDAAVPLLRRGDRVVQETGPNPGASSLPFGGSISSARTCVERKLWREHAQFPL